jgi:hypothetical protein
MKEEKKIKMETLKSGEYVGDNPVNMFELGKNFGNNLRISGLRQKIAEYKKEIK